ncbi:MAG: hypothetical protein ACLRI8_06195 [Agathobacter rectalis]
MTEHSRTKQILEKLNNTTVIEIDHYKDVFCRKAEYFCSKQCQGAHSGREYKGCIYEGAPCVRALEMRILLLLMHDELHI